MKMNLVWKLSWRRTWFEWEKPMLEDFHIQVAQSVIHKDKQDVWVWKDDKSGCYDVNSAYTKLNNDILREEWEEYTKLWNTKALPTAQICVWRALQDRLTTYENLQNRGILVNNGICVFCSIQVETNNHLFLNCVVVARIWKLCDKWAGIQFVNHSMIK